LNSQPHHARGLIAETPSICWRVAGVAAGLGLVTVKPIERLIQHVSRAILRFHVWEPSMRNKIPFYRNAAAQSQKWLCHYCSLPMGSKDSPYTKAVPLEKEFLLASAEHLQARQDGGIDSKDNIVAAHTICNRRRHRCKIPMSPLKFAAYVKLRVEKNRWFSASDLMLLREARRTVPVNGMKSWS
jgi:HNH endonuclease